MTKTTWPETQPRTSPRPAIIDSGASIYLLLFIWRQQKPSTFSS